MDKRRRHHAVSRMTADRYRKLIAKLGLSQRGATRFLGLSEVQGARMATGVVPIPPPIAMLLEVLVTQDVSTETALKLIGVNVAKAQREARAKQINKLPRFFQSAA